MDGMRSSNLYDGRDGGNFMNSRSRDNDDYYRWVDCLLNAGYVVL